MNNLKLWLLIAAMVGLGVYKYAPGHFWTILKLYLAGELFVGIAHYATH